MYAADRQKPALPPRVEDKEKELEMEKAKA
jgi:hypothetical protein